jgi:8-oxo-dGTP pyrophosphatase MutT (NUDIX family)
MEGAQGPNESAHGGAEPPKRRRRRRRRRRTSDGGTRAAQQAPAATADPKPAATPPAADAPASGTAKRRVGKRRSRGGTSAAKNAKKPASGGARGGGKPTPKHIPTTREISAGGVVYRPTDDGAIEVVLASRRTRRGQLAWGLAKGGIEIGETKEQAAIREVREETGLTADIEADLGDTKYMYVWDDIRIRKTVHFFLMRHTGGNVEDRDDEMEEIRWFPLERAIKRAAYRGERDMLVKASELLR